MIRSNRFQTLIRKIVSVPTTSFHEHRVLRLLSAHGRELGLATAQDRWGNLHVRYARRRRGRRWVLIAHCDHPGFVIVRAHGRRARGRWFGRVAAHYFRGARVLVHGDDAPPVRGRIRAARVSGARGRVQWIEIETDRPVSAGAIGTWDLPGYRLQGDRLHTRAADDLVGCALLAGLLESLVSARARAQIEVIYTRAEEAGLLGSTALARSGELSGEDAILVIETSRELPTARIGQGPVLRLGDRLTVFDPGLARWLELVARELASARRGFRYQRALMDGGTCESSSFAAHGYRATGIAIPLGNYHNMGRTRVAAERVSLSDLTGALAFLEALVTRSWPRSGWPPLTDGRMLVDLLRPEEERLRRTVSAPLHPWRESGRARHGQTRRLRADAGARRR